MVDYTKLPRHRMLCVDMKSFYASCECILRGLDPFNTYLAVIGDQEFSGSIVLASTPKMKEEYKIKTGSRLFEIPRDPKIYLVEAQMGMYLNLSINITGLLNEFVPLEAIHIYSVDEFWVCANGTERLHGDTWQLAKKIRQAIKDRYGLPSCVGIGPNKFLSKVILDIEAKKTGIAECQYEDIPKKIWPQPVEKVWGIGSRMKRNLNKMGIITMKNLAEYPLQKLTSKFGIIGEQLYWHAWGVDLSPVQGYNPQEFRKGFSQGITLLRDYEKLEEIKTVVLELCEEVARRAREVKMAGRTISLGLGYSRQIGGGFYRSNSIPEPTNITYEIYKVCLSLINQHYNGAKVRKVYVSLTNLSSDKLIQLSLFDDRVKNYRLGITVDRIRDRFGSTAILRANSYARGGTMLERAKKIGGHKA